MLLKFNCKTLENDLIPFSLWMLQVPFEPEKAQYYIAMLNSKDNEEIVTACEINPELCMTKIKTFLNGYNYKVQDLTFNKLLEPQNLFTHILIDFQN